MGQAVVELVPQLAREKAREVHPRIRRGIALQYLTRWSGILTVAVQKAVAMAVVRDAGADLATSLLEPAPGAADLPLA